MWLIPPGIFILLFTILAFYLGILVCRSKNDRIVSRALVIGSVISCCFALVTLGLSIDATAQRLMHSLEYEYVQTNVKPDVIIVLGGPNSARDKTGVMLQKRYEVDVIVTGYQGEAERMQKYMIERGIPSGKIIIEPKASNTKEHVKYVLPMVVDKGYKRVTIVTNAYHMPRSMMNFTQPFKEKGIEVVPYPCGYLTPKEYKSRPKYEWVPDIHTLQLATRAWHEYLGMLELWLFR